MTCDTSCLLPGWAQGLGERWGQDVLQVLVEMPVSPLILEMVSEAGIRAHLLLHTHMVL